MNMYFTHTHADMNMAVFLGVPNEMFAVVFLTVSSHSHPLPSGPAVLTLLSQWETSSPLE